MSLASCKPPPASESEPWPRAPAETLARTVPALIARTPLKLLLLESVRRPGPALVRLPPVPLAIAPVKATSELTVTTRVTDVPRPIAPANERTPLSTTWPSVMLPPRVTAFASWKSPTPAPVKLLLESTAASLRISEPEPRAALLPTRIRPPPRVTPPVKLPAAASVSVPGPLFEMPPPVPETNPVKLMSELTVKARTAAPRSTVPVKVSAPVFTASPRTAPAANVTLFGRMYAVVEADESVGEPDSARIWAAVEPKAKLWPTCTVPWERAVPPM